MLSALRPGFVDFRFPAAIQDYKHESLTASLAYLFDQELLVELLNEVDFLVAVEQVTKRL